MVIPRAGRMAVAVLLAAAVVSAAAVVPPPEPAGAQALGLRLRRLTNLGTVLFITAHPDDENNAVLTALSRGQGVRVALLTATRGEGGQNEICDPRSWPPSIGATASSSISPAPTTSATPSAWRRARRSGAATRSWPTSCA
jgi:hypothetical protein